MRYMCQIPQADLKRRTGKVVERVKSQHLARLDRAWFAARIRPLPPEVEPTALFRLRLRTQLADLAVASPLLAA